jgi:TPR repeat protein
VAKFFRLAAEQGHVSSQFNIGLFYYMGRSVAKDYGQAAEWFQLAAAQGHATAQHLLGVMYALGEGVSRDREISDKWFRLATEQGLTLPRFSIKFFSAFSLSRQWQSL